MNWKNWFGIPGVGQPRDPEASDIRDPGLDAAVADVRRDHVNKAIESMKAGGLWDDSKCLSGN